MNDSEKPSRRLVTVIAIILIVVVIWIVERLLDWLFG